MEIVKIEMNLKAVNKSIALFIAKRESQALFTQIQLAKPL